MFLVPCAVAATFILIFTVTLSDRRLDRKDKPAWSVRELVGTFWVSPRRNPDFAWAFTSRFFFVLAYAFLVTYQAYYLLDHLGSAEADVPRQVFLGTLVQSGMLIAASLLAGRLSDRTGRRKVFVVAASVIYGLALFAIAATSSVNGFLIGMAIGGLGFGMYMAVDLALVVDVLPDMGSAAKDLGVLNMAGALPSGGSLQRSPRSSSPWVEAATACCMPSPASAPSSQPPRSSRSPASADLLSSAGERGCGPSGLDRGSPGLSRRRCPRPRRGLGGSRRRWSGERCWRTRPPGRSASRTSQGKLPLPAVSTTSGFPPKSRSEAACSAEAPPWTYSSMVLRRLPAVALRALASPWDRGGRPSPTRSPYTRASPSRAVIEATAATRPMTS